MKRRHILLFCLALFLLCLFGSPLKSAFADDPPPSDPGSEIGVTINTAPSFTVGSDIIVPENSGSQTIQGWATNISKGVPGEESQILTFNISTDNNSLFSTLPSIDPSNGNLTFTPAVNAKGTATITVTLKDDGGTANEWADTSESQTFTITVNPVIDAPHNTAAPQVTGAMMVGSVLSANDGTWNNSDSDATGITYFYQWQTADSDSDANTVDISGATGQTFTLISDQAHKYVRIKVTAVSTGNGISNSVPTDACSSWTLVGNAIPAITEGNIISADPVDEDNTVSLPLHASDADSDTITWSIDAGASHGTAAVAGTGTSMTITYKPNTDYHGDDRFTVKINDGHNGEDTITVNVTVNSVVDSPVNEAIPQVSGTANVGQTLTSNNGTWNDPAEGSAVTITYSYQWQTADSDSDVNISDITGATTNTFNITTSQAHKYIRVKVIAMAKESGLPDSQTSEACSNWALVENAIPVITEGSTITANPVDEDNTSSFSLNASDTDGDTITWSIETSASHGTAAASGTGNSMTVTYQPDVNYNGNDSFVVKVNDGHNGTDLITVNMTVNPVNDAPVNSVLPEVTGTVKVGQTLDATAGTWTDAADGDSAVITYYYQWRAADDIHGTNAANISGATESSFKVTKDQAHKYVCVIVTAVAKDKNHPDLEGVSSEISSSWSLVENSIPVIVNGDTKDVTVNEDNTSIFTLTASDADNADMITWSIDTNASNGTATLASDTGNSMEVTYQPDTNYNGDDSFAVKISDGHGGEDLITVNMTIDPVNDAPTVSDDTAATSEDESVIVEVLTNDTDIDSNQLTVGEIITEPVHGNAVISEDGKAIVYTPADNYNGSDSFTYSAADNDGGSSNATVTVTIASVNDAPVAFNDTASTDEDSSVVIDVLANDTDVDINDIDSDEMLTIVSAGTASHGTAVIKDNKITYTPADNYNGPDTFSYVMRDKSGITSSADVTVIVGMVDDAPVAADDSITINEDAVTIVNVLSNDKDIDLATNPGWESLTIKSVTKPVNGNADIAADGKSITYTPDANYYGTDSFSYTISDEAGELSTANVSIKINSVNDAPVFSGLNDSYEVLEDGTLIIDFEISDVETAAADLMLQCSSQNETILPNSRITISGVGDSDPKCSVKLMPASNANGTVTVKLQLGDGFLVTSKSIVINVTPVNDAPVPGTDTLTFTEDTPYTFDMDSLVANDSDVDGDVLHFAGIDSISGLKGTLAIVDPDSNTYKYTPPVNFDGSTTFTYAVSDGTVTKTGTVILKAIPINDAPELVMDDGYPTSTDEDVASSGIDFTVSDPETPDKLIVQAGSSNPDVIEPENIKVIPDGDNHYHLSIKPGTDQNGTSTITLSVSDGLLQTAVSFDFDVTSVDDAPVAVDDSYTTVKNKSIILDPLKNDTEVDGESLIITSIGASANSIITDNHDGTLTYKPNAGYTGEDVVSYEISDGHSTSSSTMTIEVGPIDYPPVIHPIKDQESNEDVPISGIPLIVDNPGFDVLQYTFTSSLQSLVPDGNITYNPVNGMITVAPDSNKYGTTKITVTVTDTASLMQDSEDFNVTFYSVNDVPSIVDDSFTAAEDTPTEIDVLSNDSDIDGSLSVVLFTSPSHGRIEYSGGKYKYVPNSNYNGSDTFQYEATDGECIKSANVSITVTSVDDTPIAYNDYLTSKYADGEKTISPLNNDVDYDNGDIITLDDIVTGPAYGTASIDGQTIKYTPNSAPYGTWDTIKYRIKDNNGHTAEAEIWIARMDAGESGGGDGSNIAPKVFGESVSIAEDQEIDINLSNNFFDPEGDGCSLTADKPGHGTIPDVITGKVIHYIPDKDYNGSDTIHFTITDNAGNSGSANVTINIYPVNDSPSISDVLSQTTAEDIAVEGISVTISDPESSAEDLKFEAFSDANVLLPDENIDVSRDGGNITLTLTPSHYKNGTTNITLVASDGINKTSKSFTLTVTPVNNPPDARDISINTYEDVPVSIVVNPTFADPDGDDVLLTFITNPSHGTLKDNGDGSVAYTPDKDYNGPDSFEYMLDDQKGGTDTGTVSINVESVNDPPVFGYIDPQQFTDEDHPKTINFTLSDADNDPITLDIDCSDTENLLFDPLPDTALTHDGQNYTLTLNPKLNAFGEADFTLTASDGKASATAKFNIKVVSVNDPPAAVNDSAETLEDNSVLIDILTNDSDIEDDLSAAKLNVVKIQQPSHGTVVNNMDGTVKYTPAKDYFGIDSFVYTVADSNAAQTMATVSITVQPVNDPPKAINHTVTIDEDTSVTVNLLQGVTDVEGDTVSLVKVNNPAKGTIELLSDGRSIKYTPELDQTDTVAFTYTVSDGQAEYSQASGTVTININPYNDAPRFTPVPEETWEFNEDTVGIFEFIVYDPETLPQNLIIKLSSSDQSIVPDTSIVYSGSGTEKSVKFTPRTNAFGQFNLSVYISDGTNVTECTHPVNVLPVNDVPVFTKGEDQTIDEDTGAQTVKAWATGISTGAANENQVLNFVVETSNDSLFSVLPYIDPAAGDLAYIPAPNANGYAIVTVKLHDNGTTDNGGADTSAEQTFKITVNPVNDPPVNVTGQEPYFSGTMAVDQIITGDKGTWNDDKDMHPGSISYAYQWQKADDGTGKNAADISGATTDAYTISAADAHKYIRLKITATDNGEGLPASQSTTAYSGWVLVNNSAPVITEGTDKTVSTNEDASTSFSLHASDMDNDTITWTISNAAAHGTAATTGSGNTRTISYTPTANYNGPDSFTVKVSDGKGEEASFLVTVTVNPVNDPPVNVTGQEPHFSGTMTVNQIITGDKGTWNDDKDMHPGSISYTYQWQKADDGTGKNATDISEATVDAYTISAADAHKYIRLKVTATDNGEGLPASQSTTAYSGWVLVNNSAPVIAEGTDKTITVNEDSSTSFTLSTSDRDNDTITWSISSAAAHGTAVITGSGNSRTISYTPTANYNGPDSFTVKVSDGKGGEVSFLVTVTVNPVNDPPVNVTGQEPHFSGTMAVNQIITGDKGKWNDDKDMHPGSISYTYQWQKADDGTGKNAVDISGATADAYTISAADAHKYIRLKVTATDNGEGLPASQSTSAYSGWVLVNNSVPVIAEGASLTKNMSVDDSSISFNLNVSDLDTDAIVWNAGTLAHGTLELPASGNTRELTYTTAHGFRGSDSFTVRIADGNGGEASILVTVNVADNTKPVISLNSSADITLEVGSTYVETATASDNYDGDITSSTVKTNGAGGAIDLDMNTVGDYTICYNIEDSSGNHADQVVRNIHVIHKITKIIVEGQITGKDSGSPIPGAAVYLMDLNGKEIKNTTADTGGNYTFDDVALGNYKLVAEKTGYSTRTVEIKVVPNSTTDQRMVKNLNMVDFVITLDSNPKSIIGDGTSQSILTAAIMDKENKPIEGITVSFTADLGTFPGGNTALTDSEGKCSVVYMSDLITGIESKLTTVRAEVDDEVRDLHAYTEILVTFDPSSVQGVVRDNDTGNPIEGALVEVSKDFNGDGVTDFYSKMVTGPDGIYKIAVPQGNTTYDIKITKPVSIGGSTSQITFNQTLDVGSISGIGDTINAQNAIAGMILSKNPDGSTTRLDDYSGFTINVLDESGSPATDSHGNTISGSLGEGDSGLGTFQAVGLTSGETYTVDVTYKFDSGEELHVGTATVTVNADGETSISTILIDPYGTITDASTHQPISDVHVTLKYASTNGIVALPGITGFGPSSNANPQQSSSAGEYAFMVYPDTDYIITATKAGYQDYVSSPIHVGSSLVQFIFSMEPIPYTGGSNGVGTTISRLSGQQRVDTAIEIAKATFTGRVKNVILATSENFPDALAGSVLGYKVQAPILLVSSDNADQEKVLSYIKEYMDNTGTVYILGGTGAVNANMEKKVRNSGYANVKRLGGIDRYETAAIIAKELDVKEGTPVVFASGEEFPDALSISSIAAMNQYPILLVHKDKIDDTIKTEVAELKPGKVYIIGLQGAVSSDVENLIANMTALDKSNIVRIGGIDRYETSSEVAKYFDLSSQSICAATGNNFPDIIAGSIYAAVNNSPIILVNTDVSDSIKAYMNDKKVEKVTIFGGEGAVSKSIEDQLSQIVSEIKSKN